MKPVTCRYRLLSLSFCLNKPHLLESLRGLNSRSSGSMQRQRQEQDKHSQKADKVQYDIFKTKTKTGQNESTKEGKTFIKTKPKWSTVNYGQKTNNYDDCEEQQYNYKTQQMTLNDDIEALIRWRDKEPKYVSLRKEMVRVEKNWVNANISWNFKNKMMSSTNVIFLTWPYIPHTPTPQPSPQVPIATLTANAYCNLSQVPIATLTVSAHCNPGRKCVIPTASVYRNPHCTVPIIIPSASAYRNPHHKWLFQPPP